MNNNQSILPDVYLTSLYRKRAFKKAETAKVLAQKQAKEALALAVNYNGDSDDDRLPDTLPHSSDSQDSDSDSDYQASEESELDSMSEMSHASSEAPHSTKQEQIQQSMHSKLSTIERLAVLSQDADLWAKKWGGLSHWLYLEYSEERVSHLANHRDYGRAIIDALSDLSCTTELPEDKAWISHLLVKCISISNVVHAGIEVISVWLALWAKDDDVVIYEEA